MALYPDYATAAELRSFVTRSSSTVDDTELGYAVTAASRVVDEWCGRQFGQVTVAEAHIYSASWDRTRCGWVIEVDDIYSATGLEIMVDDDDDQVYDQEITSYRLWPFTPAGAPWTRILVKSGSAVTPSRREGAVEVTALYGWTAVPTAVKQATLIEANRIFQRRVSPFGIAGSPETGSELRLLRGVDVDAQKILMPYRRLWGAV